MRLIKVQSENQRAVISFTHMSVNVRRFLKLYRSTNTSGHVDLAECIILLSNRYGHPSTYRRAGGTEYQNFTSTSASRISERRRLKAHNMVLGYKGLMPRYYNAHRSLQAPWFWLCILTGGELPIHGVLLGGSRIITLWISPQIHNKDLQSILPCVWLLYFLAQWHHCYCSFRRLGGIFQGDNLFSGPAIITIKRRSNTVPCNLIHLC